MMVRVKLTVLHKHEVVVHSFILRLARPHCTRNSSHQVISTGLSTPRSSNIQYFVRVYHDPGAFDDNEQRTPIAMCIEVLELTNSSLVLLSRTEIR